MGFLDGANEMDLSSTKNSCDKIFYRKIYYQCKNFIDNGIHNFCCLIGPRKVGKTVCLKQIENEYSALYIDLKKDDGIGLLERIFTSGKHIILIDEITHLSHFDYFIEELAVRYANSIATNSYFPKIIITGSQAVALDYIASKSFATNTERIYTSFIDFEEWLVFKHIIDSYNEVYIPKVEDYIDYIRFSSEFSHCTSNQEYLKDCINETVKSNLNMCGYAANISDVSMGDYDNIVALTYAVLLSLHNSSSYETMFKFRESFDKLLPLLKDKRDFDREDFRDKVITVLRKYMTLISKMKLSDLKRYIRFLMQTDMIICNEKSTVLEYSELMRWLVNAIDIDGINTSMDFFSRFNLTFKYPLFFVNLCEDVIKESGIQLSTSLYSGALLDSIYECNLKGILSYKLRRNHLLEYHDKLTGDEVDFVDPIGMLMIEMSISDKKHSAVKFEVIKGHEDYRKIITSRTLKKDEYVIFYEYLLELSRGNFVTWIYS